MTHRTEYVGVIEMSSSRKSTLNSQLIHGKRKGKYKNQK